MRLLFDTIREIMYSYVVAENLSDNPLHIKEFDNRMFKIWTGEDKTTFFDSFYEVELLDDCVIFTVLHDMLNLSRGLRERLDQSKYKTVVKGNNAIISFYSKIYEFKNIENFLEFYKEFIINDY